MMDTSQILSAVERTLSEVRAKLGLLFGTWTIVALFFASRRLLFLERAKPWWVMPVMALAEWYLWALFTPIIFL